VLRSKVQDILLLVEHGSTDEQQEAKRSPEIPPSLYEDAKKFHIAEYIMVKIFNQMQESHDGNFIPPPLDKWEEKLTEITTRLNSVTTRLHTLQETDPDTDVRQLSASATQLISEGRYLEADAILDRISQRQRSSLADLEKMRMETARNAAESTRARGELAMAQLDYRIAAQHFQDAAELLKDHDRGASLIWLHKKLHAFFFAWV
jgi:hypothetical protein